MKRFFKMYSIIMVLFAAASCTNITGSWKKVSTQPQGAPFPIDSVIFDPQKQFTSTWEYDGKTHTSTGQYRYNGNTLQIQQGNNVPRNYKAKLQLDGSLVLTYEMGDKKVSATLVKEKK